MILKRKFENMFGTHGDLFFDDGTPMGVHTLEEPWRNNAPGNPNAETESCIPPGEYKYTEYRSSHLKGHLYRLHGMSGRSDILIHGGNTLKDTEGCILVGLVAVKQGVQSSQDALAWMEAHVPPTGTLRVEGITLKREVS